MAHSLFCSCKKYNPSLFDGLFNTRTPGFSKRLPGGTTIYGPKGHDKKPGNKHGHYGKDFHRTPHSTIGSAAIGRAHTAGRHPTKRWK